MSNTTQKLIDAGYKVAESTVKATKFSTYTAVHTAEVVATNAVAVGKESVVTAHELVVNTVSSVASQVNKYTPDIYDVGNNGQGDLTRDGALFVIGNSAMIAQNAVRIARIPESALVKGAANLLYNDTRLNKVKITSASQNSLINGVKIGDMSYSEIITGMSNKPFLRYADKLAFNRLTPNGMKNAGIYSRAKAFRRKFKVDRYQRMVARKQGMLRYSNYLSGKRFSLKRATKGMLANQYRKISNQILAGNDPDAMSNKTFIVANRSMRLSFKAIRQIYLNRAIFRKFFHAVTHPIQTLKAFINILVSILSSFLSIMASMPVIASILSVIIPLIISIMVITTIIFNIFGWLVSQNYTYVDIKPCDLGNSIKDGANETAVTDDSSEQYRMLFENAYGTVHHDDWGLAYIEENGIRWYCNAMATYYTNTIGDKFRITLDSGEYIYIVICDIKADRDTRQGNNDPSTACISGDGSMLEFYGRWNSITAPKLAQNGFGSLDNDLDENHKWKGSVVKVEKAIPRGNGNMNGGPNFNNIDAWQTLNPYDPSFRGQCTWFAWGRFFEIYGFSPNFSGDGYRCVGELLLHHSDRFSFSTEPVAGALFSYDSAHNHVGIVVAVEGEMVTVQEGNVSGVSWNYPFASTHSTNYGWAQNTYTKSEMRARGVAYAVPR